MKKAKATDNTRTLEIPRSDGQSYHAASAYVHSLRKLGIVITHTMRPMPESFLDLTSTIIWKAALPFWRGFPMSRRRSNARVMGGQFSDEFHPRSGTSIKVRGVHNGKN